MVPGSTVGIVANPMSGRDIRRLVAQASVFPNAEKTNMVVRLLAAAGAAGVERALVSTDGMGVAGGVVRALAKRRAMLSDGLVESTDLLQIYKGTAVGAGPNFALTPGEAYYVTMKSGFFVNYQPSHY